MATPSLSSNSLSSNSLSSNSSPVGVLLVGHGTRDEAGTREFFELGERLTHRFSSVNVPPDRFGGVIVRPCLLEFQSPTIDEAWRSLAPHQPRRVIVAPLLLFAAGHAKSDIPDAVESARRATPIESLASVDFCRPISRQATMVDAVRRRLRELGDRSDTGHDASRGRETAVVLVGRGSHDPCASADMRVLAEVAVSGRSSGADDGRSLRERWRLGDGSLFTTFYAMASPRLPDTLTQIAAAGRFRRVLIYPHLLFSGRLYDAIANQVAEAADRFADIQFHLGDYLGPTDLIAEAMAFRIENTQGLTRG